MKLGRAAPWLAIAVLAVSAVGCCWDAAYANTTAKATAGAQMQGKDALQTHGQHGSDGKNRSSSKTGLQSITEPPAPALQDIPVTKTHLSEGEVEAGLRALHQMMQGHPGDGIRRGPDNLIYNIDVAIDTKTHEFGGHMSLHLHNNLGEPVDKLYFNVWPDAYHYRKQGSYERISNVQLDGNPESFHLNGTVLTVHLDSPIQANGTAEVSMDFLTKLPHTIDRFGWQDTNITMGNWYPILAVHDEHGWVTPPYYPDGESFYSLTGAYHVHVTAPENLVLAVSGEQVGQAVRQDGTVTTDYHAVGVRDVALVGDTAYHVISGKVGKTTIYTYYEDAQAPQAKLMLDVGERSLAFFNQHYGTYPYATLRLCAMYGWFGGMEYPQLDMISFNQQQGNPPAFTTLVTAHETAHQWFFGMIGDDEFLTPWLDESFAQFSERRFDNHLSDFHGSTSVPEHVTDSVAAFPSSDFTKAGPNLYYMAIYQQGGAALNHIYSDLGEGAFDKMIKAYFQQYNYGVATSADFVNYAARALKKKPDSSYFRNLNIFLSDDAHPALRHWAKVEMAENGRDWAEK